MRDSANDQDVVKKVIEKSMLMGPELQQYAKDEIEIHELCSNHDNVVKLYDHNENEK